MLHGLMMDYPLTLDRILEHANRMHANKGIRTKQPDGSMDYCSYADLYTRAKQLANVLEGLGVEVGDRVGTFAWNNDQHVACYFGIPGAGAVCHTLNIRLSDEQLVYIINHAEDKVIIVDGSLAHRLEAIADQLPTVQHFLVYNLEPDAEIKLPNAQRYEDVLAAARSDYAWRSTDERMAMGLCYTSGTTGMPKGVLYSHRSMFLHTLGVMTAAALALTEADVLLPVVPQFHAMSWGLPYACAYVGADMVMPGPFLKSDALADLIESEQVTLSAGVPTIWNGLYHELKRQPRDISSIKALMVGGAAVPTSLIAAYETEMNVKMVHSWGMTEMSPVGTISRLLRQHQTLPQNERWQVQSRQGYFLPGVEARIVNFRGERLAWDGETMGELQVRGPWVAKQYYKVEQAPEHFTEDGWFRTGDVVTINAEGFMTIMDRTKDLVKSGGEWISSVDLENALVGHPDILEAAVIAIPDEKWTERPAAIVVRLPHSTISSTDLNAYLEKRYPRFWLPDAYIFAGEIPKTSVGKLNKKMLRRMHSDGTLA